MSNYTKTTDFGAKDSLPTGDSGKIIRGTEFETEFDAISTAIATKADIAGPTFTGTLTYETISDGTISITAFVDEDDMSSNSANLVPTQQSVKAYVDAVTTELQAQDLDFQADTGGALNIDLDTETMTFTGGTGIDTSGSGNAVTFAIDSTVTTLTGTQTLTNKTLTSPDVNTPDIDGGTIDGTVIGGTTPAAVSATTVSATGNITVGGTVDGRDVATDGSKLDGIEAGATADQTAAEIRTLVEAATDSNVFTDADHSKLDGIEAGATGDQTNAEIRAAVEAATDSNVFTDADHSKLDGIEALADVTDTTNVTAAGALMDSELTNITAVKSLDQGVATTDTPTFAGLATSANVTFGDNDKAIFGAGNDLQIYHDGSHSYIEDASGTGNVKLRTNTLRIENAAGTELSALFVQDGAVTLYNDNTARLATTSTGIDVTGTIVGDGLSVGDNASITLGASSDLRLKHTGAASFIADEGAGNLNLVSNAAAVTLGIGTIASSSTILSATSTGIDVTGTVTADGAEIDVTRSDTAGSGFLTLDLIGTSGDFAHRVDTSNAYYLDYYTGSAWRPTIKIEGQTGDISFYEDTGTTAKLFWDASAESLGVGTTSPSSSYAVDATAGYRSSAAIPNFTLVETDASGQTWQINSTGAKLSFRDVSRAADRVVIDTAGNVGIGTDSPAANSLTIEKSGTARLRLTESGVRAWDIEATSGDFRINNASGSSEAMRLDASGNLLVGKSSSSFTTAGVELAQGGTAGKVQIQRSASPLALVNLTDDGNILNFYKGTSAVGSIGVSSSDNLYIAANTADHAGLLFGTHTIYPMEAATLTGGTIDLGANGASFKDLYLSGAVRCPDYRSEGVLFLTYDADDSLQIRKDNGAEAARFDSSGNLLVGTTSLGDVNNLVTNHLFEGANSTAGAGAVGVYNNTGTANCPALVVLNRDASTDTSNRFIQFYADVTSSGSTAMGGIVGNGASNVQFAALSDAREKTNIQGISGSLTKINSLNPVEFDWIASGEHVNAGFVAQEVEQVFPEFVVENMADEGEEERKGLTGGMTGGIVAHLVKAIQEQTEIINDLRARVAQLEGEN